MNMFLYDSRGTDLDFHFTIKTNLLLINIQKPDIIRQGSPKGTQRHAMDDMLSPMAFS